MISYSVVIGVYNQKNTLQRILEGLRRQIKNPKLYEIVITDDGSSDGTEEFIKQLRFPIFLKYIRSDSPLGRSHNRNRGLQRASGQQVIFIDGDMIPLGDFIAAYQTAWQQYAGTVCVGTRTIPDQWKSDPVTQYLGSRGRLTMRRGEVVPGRYFTSDNFSISKRILDDVGLFDTDFKGWGGEDTDFGFRLENKNIPIVYVPEAACEHYHHKSIQNVISEYAGYGQGGFPILSSKHPEKTVFDKGWLLGLPAPGLKLSQRFVSIMLWPLRTFPVLFLLRSLAIASQGRVFNGFLFDWLFYGYLARGYRRRNR